MMESKQSYGFTFQDGPFVGRVYRVPYPFCHATYIKYSDDSAGVKTDTWRPGIEYRSYMNSYQEPDDQAVADGVGYMLLEVIDIHKPGRFPERVFYTRKWETPEGKVFGKVGLRIITTPAFRRLSEGFRYEYELA